MDKKNVLIGGGVVVVIVIVGGLWWWMSRPDDSTRGPVVNGVELDTTVPESIPPLKVAQEALPPADEPVVYEDEEGEQLKQVARVFVEAWGSQSPVQSFQSLDMAMVYATQSMKAELAARKAALLAEEQPAHITTSVHGLQIEDRSAARIEVVASALRVERLNGEVREYNQKAYVTLVLVGAEWLVGEARWASTAF